MQNIELKRRSGSPTLYPFSLPFFVCFPSKDSGDVSMIYICDMNLDILIQSGKYSHTATDISSYMPSIIVYSINNILSEQPIMFPY